jgi:phage terminase small subunit
LAEILKTAADGRLILIHGKFTAMRIRQMGFSSRLKAHRHLLTLETLKFIIEYLKDPNVKSAAARAGIPDTYAARQGAWLMKLPIVKKALENDLDDRDLRRLTAALKNIDDEMQTCRKILSLDDDES